MAVLMDEISAFLQCVQRKKFRWGTLDCLLFVSDAMVAQGLPDPAAQWRGKYRTRKQAYGIIEEHGGVVGLFETGMDHAGARRLSGAKRGCVAVVSPVSGAGEPMGGVWTGSMWALLPPTGLAMFSPECLEVVSSWRQR
jgi:hypothetical protein